MMAWLKKIFRRGVAKPAVVESEAPMRQELKELLSYELSRLRDLELEVQLRERHDQSS